VADPTAWASVRQTLHIGLGYVPTPLAFEGFFNSLATTPQTGWQAVSGVAAIEPGDILAWQPALPDGQPDTSGVGHSVMPLVAPQPIAGSGGTRWEVVVMDSTAGGHGPDDTRKPQNAIGDPNPLSERNAPILTRSQDVEPSGLGIGTIALDTTPPVRSPAWSGTSVTSLKPLSSGPGSLSMTLAPSRSDADAVSRADAGTREL